MKKQTDKIIVETVIDSILQNAKDFAIPQVRDELKKQDFDFGTTDELIDFAERQKTRFLVGQLLDENGKKEICFNQKTNGI
jgi:hypothetical protein